ncbi:MAG: hypothetical protein ACI857_003054 [Arenicella sp.]|jgi:hypothetical protein
MYKITDNQVDFILNDIEERGVTTEDVRYNILDHVCCIIENEMKGEMNFKEFYRSTIARFYRKQLGEIEEETQILLTFKNYHAMKRTLKISGIISIILFIVGIIFKTMHWPGASVMILLGLVFFSLVFIPLNIVLKFQDDKEKKNRIIMTLGLITASVASIGVLFKIMHWPAAGILLFSSLLVFMVIFIPIYFIIKFKDPETKFTAIINTTFMLAAAGMVFALVNLGHAHEHFEESEEVENTESQEDSAATSEIEKETLRWEA